ncbi:hypothetical protein [Bradyrhizobium sp. USDA 4486]
MDGRDKPGHDDVETVAPKITPFSHAIVLRKRGTERAVFAAMGKSNTPRGTEMRAPRLRAGPLHLAAIVLMHFACMSLIVWLSL